MPNFEDLCDSPIYGELKEAVEFILEIYTRGQFSDLSAAWMNSSHICKYHHEIAFNSTDPFQRPRILYSGPYPAKLFKKLIDLVVEQEFFELCSWTGERKTSLGDSAIYVKKDGKVHVVSDRGRSHPDMRLAVVAETLREFLPCKRLQHEGKKLEVIELERQLLEKYSR